MSAPSNPFDHEEGVFLVLSNMEQQQSLWPEFVPVPMGWHIIFGPDSRTSCSEYVERQWSDLRPLSLREHTRSSAS